MDGLLFRPRFIASSWHHPPPPQTPLQTHISFQKYDKENALTMYLFSPAMSLGHYVSLCVCVPVSLAFSCYSSLFILLFVPGILSEGGLPRIRCSFWQECFEY